MQAVEFTTELHGAATIPILGNIAAQLPGSGIVLTNANDDGEWQVASCNPFLKDDSAADAVYEALA